MEEHDTAAEESSPEVPRNLFRNLVERSPEAMYVHDGKAIIYANSAAASLFGAESSRCLIGRSPYELYPVEVRAAIQERMELLLAGYPVPVIEKKVTRADGSAVDVEVRVSCFFAENKPLIHVLLLDISRRKKVEAAFRRQSSNLIAVNQSLESFAQSISHDLRNPLNSILGCCEVLKSSVTSNDPDIREALQHIMIATRHMAQIITDLMSLSSVTLKEMQLSKCNLGALALAVIEELQRTDAKRKVDIVIEAGLVVDADEGLIRILMENLIQNAWKFTAHKPDARIELGKRVTPTTTNYFVRDNGVGFDIAQADRLFKPFHRLHSAHDYAGTGIGLTIVKQIVEKHGGTIQVEAEKDKGATFSFSLGGGNNQSP
jgi:PAS domain S-box-containing protein